MESLTACNNASSATDVIAQCSPRTWRIAALCLVILTKTAMAQTPPVPQWQQCFGYQHLCPGSLTSVVSFFPKTSGAGYWPQSGLVRANDGSFYGTTTWGGDLTLNGGRGYGTVFRIAGGKLQTVHSFTSYSPGKADGELPNASMIKASDGTLWGVAGHTIFQIGTDGTYKSFGALPVWSGQLNRLTQGSDGNIYGTSFDGGASISDAGTFFRFTPEGVATLLHSFKGADGIHPTAVTEGPDGYFYGMSPNDGIFKISPAGDLTIVAGPATNSALFYPPRNGLILGTDGKLYGVFSFRQLSVFSLTTDGSITRLATLADYGLTNDPLDSLVEAGDGNLYGATASGVFQITKGGAVTVIYAWPNDLTIMAGEVWEFTPGSDGLYAVSSAGGQACAKLLPGDCTDGTSGTIFKINTTGGSASGGGNGAGTPSTSSIDAVDPNVQGLSSLLPLAHFGPQPWINSSYDLFANSLHTVAALAADGVTPLVLRFRPPATGGTVKFSIVENESGTLGCLDPGDCSPPSPGVTTATATIRTLADGSPMAFALLQAPIDFVRSGPNAADTAAQTRQITITAVANGSTAPAQSMTLTLWRPPVVLLHGVWSNGCTWKWTLPGFVYYAEDYEATNSSRFAVNALEPKKGIQHVLQGMRAPGIAVTQADFVGHSMGGLLARLYAGGAYSAVPYQRNDNLGYGDIHKLITLDSPHLGSELANALVDQTNSVTGLGEAFQTAVEAANFSQNFKSCRPAASIANFLPPYCVTCGAVMDLSAGSAVLSSMPEVQVPSHAIAAVGGSTALNALQNFTQAMSAFGGPASEIAELLGDVSEWYQAQFFNNTPHDLIVSEQSQLGGLTGPSNTSLWDVDLTNGYWAVHFTVTGEQRIADEVASLLNAPTLSPAFSFLPATVAPGPMFQQTPNALRRGIVQDGVRITSPRSSTTLAPGELIPVTIEPAPGFRAARILLIVGRHSVVLHNAPFTAMVPIPPDTRGNLSIVAFGIDEDGSIARSEKIQLHVDPLIK